MVRRELAFVAVGGLLLLLLSGLPPQLSYVYSDSMEPTIGEGDGYVIGPAGDISAGDIIVFTSETRGEHVTHRVVEVTDGGYLTKGDNNPSTDQATGHPAVTDETVIGSVLMLGDRPLVIPRLGAAVSLISTYWPLGVLAVLLGGSLAKQNPRNRDIVRVDDLMTPLVVTAVLGTAVGVVYSAPTYTMTFTAITSGAGGGRLIPVGESAVRSIEVAAGPRYTYQFVEGAGVDVRNVAAVRDGYEVVVGVPAQSSGGVYTGAVTSHHYPAVLPYRLVGVLHAVHPVAASFASIGTLVAPLYAVHRLVVDGRAPIGSQSRSRTTWWEFR